MKFSIFPSYNKKNILRLAGLYVYLKNKQKFPNSTGKSFFRNTYPCMN